MRKFVAYIPKRHKNLLQNVSIDNNFFLSRMFLFQREEISSRKIMITALHAGHCIGSVMFLLESWDPQVSVLYTGDIRLSRIDVEKMESFIRYILVVFYAHMVRWGRGHDFQF